MKTERQRQPRPVWPRPWLAHDRRGFVRCLGQQAAAIAGLLVALALLAYGLWYGAVLPVAHRWAVFGVRQVAVQERLVALTFDDGPQPPYTEQILQVLDRFQVRATFFEIGRQIDRYPALTQAVIQRGHELGNHSYSHRNLILRWPGEIAAEIAETDRRLRAAGVAGPIAVRPPLGKRWLILPYLLWRSQRTLAMWNVDSGDYDPAADVSALVQQVLTQVQPGSIVLMHDGSLDPRQSRDRTVAALAVLIPALRDRGYRLVTLQELLRSAQAHGWTASTQD